MYELLLSVLRLILRISLYIPKAIAHIPQISNDMKEMKKATQGTPMIISAHVAMMILQSA